MPPKSLPEPWNSFFTEIDAHLNEDFELRCLGGFVMTVLYGLLRPTSDVDILPVGSLSAIDSLIALAGEGSLPVSVNFVEVNLRVLGFNTNDVIGCIKPIL